MASPAMATAGAASGETRRIWACLVAAAGVHAASALLPDAWLWGGAPIRWAPAAGWLFWLVFAMTLVPALASGAAGALERTVGRWCGDRWPGVVAGAAALCVILLPDRLSFVGDFLLRQGTIELEANPGPLSPGALPLEVLVHERLPTWLYDRLGVTASASGRLIGAVAAGALAFSAAALSRRLVPGAPGWRWAMALLLTFGGWCTLFAGYSRAVVELVWLLPAAAVLALDARSSARALLGLSGVVGFALLLHGAALALLPAWAVLAWSTARRGGEPLRMALLGAVAVVAALAITLPTTLASLAAGSGIARSPAEFFDPLRLLDLANGALALFPLLPLVALVALDAKRLTTPDSRVLLVLAAPLLLLALFTAPEQGIFRDLDALAPAAMAMALLAAAALGSAIRGGAVAAWPALPVGAGAVALTLSWLAVNSNPEAGTRRIVHWAEKPPVRTAAARAAIYAYVAQHHLHAGRFVPAAAAAARAGELAPSARSLVSWAVAAEMAGDWDGLERASKALLALEDPAGDEPYRVVALIGLARVAARRGDAARFHELARAVREAAPGNPLVDQLLREAELLGVAADSSQAVREKGGSK